MARSATTFFRSTPLMLAMAFGLPLQAAAGDLSPTEQQAIADLGQLPAFDSLALSPDGTRLAYVGTLGDERHVLVKQLSDGRKLADFTPAPGQKLRWLHWADNDHLLTTVSMTTAVSFLWLGEWGEYFGIIAADMATGKAWDVLKFPGGVANNAGRYSSLGGRVWARESGGETWLYVRGYFAAGAAWEARGQMMKINLVTQEHRLIENRDLLNTYDALIDERGELIAAARFNEDAGRWTVVVGPPGKLQAGLTGESSIDLPSLEGISPDGREIWLRTLQDGVSIPRSLALATGAESDSVVRLGVHRADWHGVLLDRRNGRIVAGLVEAPFAPTYEFLDEGQAVRWRRVAQALGNVRPTIVSYSDDLGKVIVMTQSSAGPQYLLVDMDSAHITPLGPQYRHVPTPAEVSDITYPASDGLVIPAFLTLPSGRQARGLALIVLPHGGPESSNGGGFDWWAQALAYEGYAVLQPNFRGSTVSGALQRAGEGEWGRKMQTDLSDGVRYLVDKGIADPARVCIVGASYGGYAALAGISMQQGIYRCAVSVAGVSDLRDLMKKAGSLRGERYLERWLGVSSTRDHEIDDRSPLNHVDAIAVPLLLVHGRDDTVVRFDQSSRVADQLKRLHKPYELVDLQVEDHWLSHGRTRQRMLEATVAFLKTHNPT